MIPLISKKLLLKTIQFLAKKQQSIDVLIDFREQSKKAKTLWESKRGSKAGRLAFDEIKSKLIDMAVSVELCNYCENNEATDVEHIFPKDWFPASTFSWENYLLACRTCNTDFKKNHFAIFHPASSTKRIEINSPPPNQDSAFINPRKENPLDFFILQLRRGIFVIHPNLKSSSRNYLKAEYTLNLLGLNTRAALVQSRKVAATYYLDRLGRYVLVAKAKNFKDLDKATDPLKVVDNTNSFDSEKSRLLEAIKKEILTYAHPTVWAELKRQKDHLPRTNLLFQQVPTALNW